jgi:hypothetical protein
LQITTVTWFMVSRRYLKFGQPESGHREINDTCGQHETSREMVMTSSRSISYARGRITT